LAVMMLFVVTAMVSYIPFILFTMKNSIYQSNGYTRKSYKELMLQAFDIEPRKLMYEVFVNGLLITVEKTLVDALEVAEYYGYFTDDIRISLHIYCHYKFNPNKFTHAQKSKPESR
jgi:hypothetical protein